MRSRDAIRVRVRLVAALLLTATAASGFLDHPTEPDVVVASGIGGRSTWFPTVTRLHNGTLVVVYYDASSHAGPDGRIALTHSRDGGRTWSAPTVVIDTPLDDRDPSVVALSNGTLVANWFEVDFSTTPLPTPGGVWTSRSTDGGNTWSPPVRARSARYGEGEWKIPPGGSSTPGIATSAKIVELRDGSLLLPVYGNTPDDPNGSITLLRSLDGGCTWPPSLELPVATHPPGNTFTEPALALLGDGSLQMAIRTNNVGYWTSSRDGGLTWSPPEPTGSYYQQASDLLPIGEGGGRLLLHTWGEASTLLGPGRPTAGCIITPDGARHEPKVIYSHGSDDESYPSSVEIGPGVFFTVFYDAQRKIIGGTYSHIAEYLCGDGVVDAGESCDDGNTSSHDGCDAACQIEQCFACVGEPSICAPLDDGTPCDDGDACTETDACSNGSCVGTDPITTCTDGDGCCPNGCVPIDDDDCTITTTSTTTTPSSTTTSTTASSTTTTTLPPANQQMKTGKLLLVKNPKASDPTKRKIVYKVKERASSNTIVGDPTVNGAKLKVRLDANTDCYDMPASGWSAIVG